MTNKSTPYREQGKQEEYEKDSVPLFKFKESYKLKNKIYREIYCAALSGCSSNNDYTPGYEAECAVKRAKEIADETFKKFELEFEAIIDQKIK